MKELLNFREKEIDEFKKEIKFCRRRLEEKEQFIRTCEVELTELRQLMGTQNKKSPNMMVERGAEGGS